MPQENYHEHLQQSYIKFMAIRDLINPSGNDIYLRAQQTQRISTSSKEYGLPATFKAIQRLSYLEICT